MTIKNPSALVFYLFESFHSQTFPLESVNSVLGSSEPLLSVSNYSGCG